MENRADMTLFFCGTGTRPASQSLDVCLSFAGGLRHGKCKGVRIRRATLTINSVLQQKNMSAPCKD